MESKSAAGSKSKNDTSTFDGRLATFEATASGAHMDDLASERRQWPETAAIDPSKLARAGFFLSQNGSTEADDTVECFACHRRVSNWKFNDSALRRHRDAYADCPFLNNVVPRELDIASGKACDVRFNSNLRQLSDSVANSSCSVTQQTPLAAVVREDTVRRRSLTTTGTNSNEAQNYCSVASVVSADADNHCSTTPHETATNAHGGTKDAATRPVELRIGDGRETQKQPLQSSTPSRFASETSHHENADHAASAHAVGLNATTDADAFLTASVSTSDADSVFNAAPAGSFVADSASIMALDDSPDPLSAGDASLYSPRSPQQVPEYFSHDARLRSFTSHDQPWPISHIVPADLAEAGFFYTGEMDKVQCAFCSGVLSRFQPGENAWNEHVKYYPTCPLVRNRLASARSGRLQPPSKFRNGGEVRAGVENDVPRITLRRNSEDGLTEDSGGNADRIGQDVTGIYADTMTNAQIADHPHSMPRRHLSHRASSPPLSEDDSDEELGILPNNPKRPDLATVDERIATFASNSPTGAVWPQHDVVQTPKQLAEAGFYFTGTRDCTKCFFCDGSLNGWQRDDDPFVEHARFYPNCGYLLSTKGRPFIAAAVANHCPTSHSPPTSRQVSFLPSEIRISHFDVLPSSTSSTTLSTEADKFAFSSNQQLRVPDRFVQQARQLGFTDSRIRQAIEQLSREQQPYAASRASCAAANLTATPTTGPAAVLTTFGPLLQHILRGADRTTDEAAGSTAQQALHSFSRFNSDPTGAGKQLTRPSVAGESSRQDRFASLGEEDPRALPQPSQQTSSRGEAPVTTCKICMDREVGVAFLPCSHLVSCAYCAPALKFCPVCRSPIKKIFKTYLA